MLEKSVTPCCADESAGSRWSPVDSVWVCNNCGTPLSNDPSYMTSRGSSNPPFWKENVCTCGAEKTYGKSTGHSAWCDKK